MDVSVPVQPENAYLPTSTIHFSHDYSILPFFHLLRNDFSLSQFAEIYSFSTHFAFIPCPSSSVLLPFSVTFFHDIILPQWT
jgi:hypothetical protein